WGGENRQTVLQQGLSSQRPRAATPIGTGSDEPPELGEGGTRARGLVKARAAFVCFREPIDPVGGPSHVAREILWSALAIASEDGGDRTQIAGAAAIGGRVVGDERPPSFGEAGSSARVGDGRLVAPVERERLAQEEDR